jgi:pimeloyl-ACP methyl ester carboxylesterase
MLCHTHDIGLGPSQTLHLKSQGDGPDIVLIHGALTTHADWIGPLFEAIAHRGRALAVDRPGHGLSRRPRLRASPLAQAQQIREGVQRLEVHRPILVGHSFGGVVALAWAAAYPEEIAGVVLAAPLAFQEWRPLEHSVLGPRAWPWAGPILSGAAVRTTDPMLLRLVQRIMFAPAAPPRDWLARYPEDQVLDPWVMVAEGEDSIAMLPGVPALNSDYRAIVAPVSVIAGAKDRVVDPHRHALRLRDAAPTAKVEMLPDAGHMLHHTHTDRLLEAIDRMLEQGEPTSSRSGSVGSRSGAFG